MLTRGKSSSALEGTDDPELRVPRDGLGRPVRDIGQGRGGASICTGVGAVEQLHKGLKCPVLTHDPDQD